MDLKITTIIENNPDDDNLLFSEHGLSLYIEYEEKKILFDTGQSGNFIKNAELLKININKLDYVVLSHGHYDHTGGIRKFVNKNYNSYKLIVGKNFFNKKYKLVEKDNYKYIGNSFDKEYIHQNNIEVKYIEEDIFYITENIMIFSNFKASNKFEQINKIFQIKQDENYIVDDFSDEKVLVLKHKKGLIVIVGCSHVGIVNILETIIERTGMTIYGIVGGTHLVEASEKRLKNTISYFKEKDISLLAMSHCTGKYAIEKIKHEFKDKYTYNNTGNVIKIV
ncbi:MBL fold metallo-hydrolase [Clostridium estertheticum]|uniref:MBL fold metallo-hydrolase n=1 Tax=Clostridium estertheticum TaxID=238834 RepID=UPI001C0B20CA|nr:MBL fold metallo-hydrolase [Clostridium estertheticum]MBU3213774.1 MBL fold metallo-hydrolase [Clostridium estertheticum]WAG53662.1 MBL fold metallo-hydrolase [Clostridium estertheticum]